MSKQRTIFFRTKIGWCSLSQCDGVIARMSIAHRDRKTAFEHLREHDEIPVRCSAAEKPWIEQLQDYLSGKTIAGSDELVTFGDWRIDESWMTDFQRAVVRACRRIPLGTTVSYGQLATQAGSPRAARAVGSVMKANRFPLIVPCHRVLASTGIGGYNAPQGISLKRRLLDMEAAQVQTTK